MGGKGKEKPGKGCVQCSSPRVPGRIWCPRCLGRLQRHGVTDLDDWPTRDECYRAGAWAGLTALDAAIP